MTVRQKRTTCFLLLAVLVLVAHSGTHAQPLYRVAIQQGVRAKMRDGVSLVADVYRPVVDANNDEKFPVLLQRTPYNRTEEVDLGNGLATHGYIVVIQDVRGRFDSAGEFYPFRNESADGYDSVEWAATLDHSIGKVGMFGGSYVGATQMLAAMAVPPHLVAIFPYVTASEYYDGWTYQNGAWMQWFSSSWTSGLVVDTMRRQAEATLAPKDWVNVLPPRDYQLLNAPQPSSLAPYFRDWLAHERDDAYWQQVRVSDYYSRMAVMGLHAGGWHDIFLKGTIKNYNGLRQQASTAEARASQHLVIGPWAHAPTSAEGKVGDITFGKQAVLEYTPTAVKWFDYSLKGIKNEYASDAAVRLFIMGDNVWRDEQEFPLARTRTTKYYLHSTKGANSVSGDGVLSVTAPSTETKDEFDYDPQNPVHTIGGRLCCNAALPPGPMDQRPNESRSDVLVFSTPPLTEDTEVTGFITVDLFASTSAVDTDFTALLVDVDETGYARFLTDGIVRAKYRESTKEASLLTPGKIYQYTIDLWATANVFKAGHRIRLYVSSSNFPRFNRNLNTGEDIAGATRSVRARQAIYHDREHPSALILPLIPRR